MWALLGSLKIISAPIIIWYNDLLKFKYLKITPLSTSFFLFTLIKLITRSKNSKIFFKTKKKKKIKLSHLVNLLHKTCNAWYDSDWTHINTYFYRYHADHVNAVSFRGKKRKRNHTNCNWLDATAIIQNLVFWEEEGIAYYFYRNIDKLHFT